MDRAGFVGGDGEGGLANHGAEGLLLDAEGILVLHFRELGVVLGGQSGDVVCRVAAGQSNVHSFIGGKGDDVVWQAADDLAEETGGQD